MTALTGTEPARSLWEHLWEHLGEAMRVGGCDCRAARRPAGPAFPIEGGATPVALDVHLEDGGVVYARQGVRDRAV